MMTTDGTTTDSYDYTAWGGMVQDGTNFHNPYIYTGREAGENGLYYYRARYYLPEVGRFGSVDKGSLILEIPISLQQFLYTMNRPNAYTDPLGLQPIIEDCTAEQKTQVLNAYNDAVKQLGICDISPSVKRKLKALLVKNIVIKCKDISDCGQWDRIYNRMHVGRGFPSCSCDFSKGGAGGETILHELIHATQTIAMPYRDREQQAFDCAFRCYDCDVPKSPFQYENIDNPEGGKLLITPCKENCR